MLTMSTDEAALCRVVGPDTFVRGRDYARRGAVLTAQWRPEDEHIFGQVRGTARTPYTAVAVVARARDGALTSFRGSCTCPVGANCKHTVALVLAGSPDVDAAADDVAYEAGNAPWERSLADLVAATAQDTPTEPAVALQFELVRPAATATRWTQPAGQRLDVRPVVPGKNGGWVRTGISWSTLGYQAYRHSQIAEEHLRLLSEIHAMCVSRSTAYYGYGNQPIQLQSVTSRRIWDLLAEARAMGVPLVQIGRESPPVRLYRTAAELVLEASRTGEDIALRPYAVVDGDRAPLDASLLIGDPAHGIAWWPADGERGPQQGGERGLQRGAERGPQQVGELRLARLTAPLDRAVHAFVAQGFGDRGPLRIPARDENRFFAGYYPALRQRMRLFAVDDSIVLPEPAPPSLTLTVSHRDENQVDLDWQWRYVLGETTRLEPLHRRGGSAYGRDLGQENTILSTVTAIAEQVPALCEASLDGTGLAAAVALAGIDTVRFTTDVLPQLAELTGVTVETRGEAAEYREAATAAVIEIAGAESAEDRDWFDLAVTVSIDGEDVPFQQLFVAVSTGDSHLILPSGTYFALDRPEFHQLAELIAEARALQDFPGDTLRLSRFQASLWDDLERLGIISGQAAVWQQSVRALTDVADLVEQPLPVGLRATLRPYQHEGFAWLAFLFANRLGGVLADEMGLGKTVQTLALMSHVREQHLSDDPFLVVAPTSVVANWAAECRRFAPDLTVETITETRTRRGCDLATIAARADVVVTSYTLFRLEHDGYAAIDWAGLVLDEAQFAKNRQSLNYQCAKKLAAPFKLAITGTPMENNLMELWSLLSITAPGLFASPTRFEQLYRTPIEKGRNAELLARLRRRVRPLMLRRTKEQVLDDLPAKQEQVIELPLNPKHRRVYQTHLHRERQKVLGLLGDMEKNRFAIFRSLTLLRQASLDVALVDPANTNVPSTKLDALMELLTEIVGQGHRTLVFSQFTRFLDSARRRLDADGIDYCYLDGSTRNRGAVLEEFTTGSAPVFLISLKAGGFGLNLTQADYCILLDPWWNPATESQAVDRVHRIGQTKKVMVYRLVAKDTIEDKVMALKATKAALFGSVMNSDELSSGVLTAADIRGMLD